MCSTRAEAQEEFIALLRKERIRQDKELWGVQTHGGHTWCGILGEEYGEFCTAVNDSDFKGAEDELVQVAAVACAAFEQSRIDQALDPQWGTMEGHSE